MFKEFANFAYRVTKLSSTKRAEELALVTAVIREDEVLNGTLWQTFDNNYKIAVAFIEKYGVDEVKWGLDYDMDFEETVVEFARNYAEENQIR